MFSINSRQTRNRESAAISVPSQLIKVDENRFEWRADLASSAPFWEGDFHTSCYLHSSGWFLGLSDKFLGIIGGKLLVLAGTERLDKPLTIGQMQGLSNHFSQWI